MSSRLLSKILTMSAALAVSSSAFGQAPADLPKAAEQVAAATALAGNDLKTPLSFCDPNPLALVGRQFEVGFQAWVKPIKLFDNLFYVGNRFVGSYILETSAGLIMFDAGTGDEPVRDHLVPGIRELGLDPAQIRYVIVTHGHWDHFGGASYLQKKYGSRIALSEADWTFIEHAPQDWHEIEHRTIPRRDIVVRDGQKLTLGDTTVTLYITPGHSHGPISAIVPVRDHGETRIFSLLGSTAFPAAVGYNSHNAGLKNYDASVLRFGKISVDAGAVGLLNTHAFADGGLERLDSAAAQGSGAPLLIGADAVKRYYGILDHCLQAAIIRAEANPPPPSKIY